MNTLVLYSSKYGSTRQYAEWLAEEFSADLVEATAAPDFASYDTVIFGAPVYGGAIVNIATIANNMHILQNKRLFIFTVGITPANAEQTLENLLEKNYTPLMRKTATTFHLLGNLEYKKLSLHHKLLMKMITSSMPNKLDMNQQNVSRQALAPLIEAVRGETHE